MERKESPGLALRSSYLTQRRLFTRGSSAVHSLQDLKCEREITGKKNSAKYQFSVIAVNAAAKMPEPAKVQINLLTSKSRAVQKTDPNSVLLSVKNDLHVCTHVSTHTSVFSIWYHQNKSVAKVPLVCLPGRCNSPEQLIPSTVWSSDTASGSTKRMHDDEDEWEFVHPTSSTSDLELQGWDDLGLCDEQVDASSPTIDIDASKMSELDERMDRALKEDDEWETPCICIDEEF